MNPRSKSRCGHPLLWLNQDVRHRSWMSWVMSIMRVPFVEVLCHTSRVVHAEWIALGAMSPP